MLKRTIIISIGLILTSLSIYSLIILPSPEEVGVNVDNIYIIQYLLLACTLIGLVIIVIGIWEYLESISTADNLPNTYVRDQVTKGLEGDDDSYWN